MQLFIKITALAFAATFIGDYYCYGQSANTDSLKSVLMQDESGDFLQDTATVLQLLNISESYRFSDLDSSLKYASFALDIANEINYKRGLLKAKYIQGSAYFSQGEYQKVYETASQALENVDDSAYKEERAIMNQLLGLSYAAQGSYEPGLRYFMNAKEMFEETGNDLGFFQNLNNIGVTYLKIEDYKKALNIFLELDSLRTLEPATISIPVNLGFIYYELNELDKAEKNLQRVISFDTETSETFDRRAMGLATFKLGEIYRAKEQYQLSLDYFKRSIAEYDNLGNELEKVQSLNGMALTYLEMDEPKRAEEFALKAYEITLKFNSLPQKQSSAETLYRIYEEQGDYQKALDFHVLYKASSDSLKNDELSKEIGRLEAEFEYDRRELELLDLQRQRNTENARQVNKQQTYLIVLLALLAIAIVIAYLSYRNSSLRKKANKLLKEKNEEIELQAEKLQEMNDIKNHLFSIISHDLRGPLSSLYAFITLYEMNALDKDDIQKLMPELSSRFKYTSNLLNNLLNWSKSQMEGYSTNPEKFQVKELFNKSSKVLEQKAADKSITIENNIEESAIIFADKNMIDLVFLNLLSNAIKFTPEGGHIQVSSSQDSVDQTKLCIEDNGIGISEENLKVLFKENNFYSSEGTNAEKGTGLGLMLCMDFINRNKGKLWAVSEIDKGSTFCFTLPSSPS